MSFGLGNPGADLHRQGVTWSPPKDQQDQQDRTCLSSACDHLYRMKMMYNIGNCTAREAPATVDKHYYEREGCLGSEAGLPSRDGTYLRDVIKEVSLEAQISFITHVLTCPTIKSVT